MRSTVPLRTGIRRYTCTHNKLGRMRALSIAQLQLTVQCHDIVIIKSDVVIKLRNCIR